MGNEAIGLLRERVDNLDQGHMPIVSFDADPRLLHFIVVMGAHTSTIMTDERGRPPILAADDADAIAASCRLLDSIARDQPSVVHGPLDRERQHWIGTGRHLTSPHEFPTLARSRLRLADDAIAPSTKPFGVGLYTSTPGPQGRGMWRTYLDVAQGSSLYPLPWATWEIQARDDASVVEITSARDWVEFVSAYARTSAGTIYPDWRAVARQLDGVHITIRAVLAIQGFSFTADAGITAPAYWDVESTLWLRWCFASVNLNDVAREG